MPQLSFGITGDDSLHDGISRAEGQDVSQRTVGSGCEVALKITVLRGRVGAFHASVRVRRENRLAFCALRDRGGP
jgi:hypothetical protein